MVMYRRKDAHVCTTMLLMDTAHFMIKKRDKGLSYFHIISYDTQLHNGDIHTKFSLVLFPRFVERVQDGAGEVK